MERKKNISGSKKGLQPFGMESLRDGVPLGWSPLGPKLFLEFSREIPIFDVRSPKEFQQGHIPGAFSLPLFSDEERAVVGTTYTHQGKEHAILKGLGIVGPKLEYFVRTALELAPQKEALVHCWRGGMRSEAMAWLLQFSGIKTRVLAGGYKAYRHFIREAFSQGPEVIILGGMTGSGKTELLNYLASKGEQVVDLEAIAHHKGSAFGALGQEEQPTNEQFENDLADQWLKLDPGRPVWLEDESRNIGKVIIPDLIFERMGHAKVVCVDVPFKERVKRLNEEYGGFDKAHLSSIISKISKRIGGDVAGIALKFLDNGDVEEAVAIILRYYDKTYLYGLSKRQKATIVNIGSAEFRRGYAEVRRGLGR